MRICIHHIVELLEAVGGLRAVDLLSTSNVDA